MIEVEALTKRFRGHPALDEVSLIVGAGQYASMNLYRKATA
jgi:ABC-type multidrug transport system ATPase subunit